MSRTAIVLAGHGSHVSPNTAGIVWEAVDALRRINAAAEITAAFWKELPSFSTVLDGIDADDVAVVPLFTAQGYFTRTVIPAEMGIEPLPAAGHEPLPQAVSGKTIRYTRTLGEHPRIADIVRSRVDTAVAAAGVPLDQIAIAVIGHSTSRNPDSRKATEAQAALLRAGIPAREVVAVYLDDMPAIPNVYRMTSAPYIVAVPYFLAAGSHTTNDVPDALGLEPGRTAGEIDGRMVIYTPPLGSASELAAMALDLVRGAGSPANTIHPGSTWSAFPAVGFEDMQRMFAAAPVEFGQLLIGPDDVRHALDAGRDDLTVLSDPPALRRLVREDPFRPLSTSTDLPRGWRVPIRGAGMAHCVVETVYPGVLGTTSRVHRGGLDPLAWQAVMTRQTGQFRELGPMTDADRAAVMVDVCGRCILHPVWAGITAASGGPVSREPCNVWLSTAMKRAGAASSAI
jgi:sirohydrochlorin cobaltochelatase